MSIFCSPWHKKVHLGNQFVSQSCTVLGVLWFAFIKCVYRPCYAEIMNSPIRIISAMREEGTALRITGISFSFIEGDFSS